MKATKILICLMPILIIPFLYGLLALCRFLDSLAR